jgi:preprotein translocase subunit SecY
MGQLQARSAAAAIPLAGLSPAEPRPPSVGLRVLFTLAALLVFRLGSYIPLPGIDPAAWEEIFRTHAGGVLGALDAFSGGAIHRMAIFALNFLPCIFALVIVHLMAAVSPALEWLKTQDRSGRQVINQYARYLTVVLAALQACGIAVGLESWSGGAGSAVVDPGWLIRVSTVATLVGGTMLLMWLAEQITAHGVGEGLSVIVLAGILAQLPAGLAQTLELGRQGALSGLLILAIAVGAVAAVTFIVFMERAERRVLIQLPKRQVANRLLQGPSSHLPLRLNASGVIPPIFASLLLSPITTADFSDGQGAQSLSTIASLPSFLLLYIALIVLLAFLGTAVMFNPTETANTLKSAGGFIPGIRPGDRTAEYIGYVLARVTMIGAGYMALVCAVPELLTRLAGLPFRFSGALLLVAIVLALELMNSIAADRSLG